MTEPWPALGPASLEEISVYHSVTGLPPLSKPVQIQPKLLQLTSKRLTDATALWNSTPPQFDLLILEAEAQHILRQCITIFQNKYKKYQKLLGLTQDSKSRLISDLEAYFSKICALDGSHSRSTTLANFEPELKTYLLLVLARYVGSSRTLLSAVEEIDPNFIQYFKSQPGPRTEKGRAVHGGPGCLVLPCIRIVLEKEANAIAEIWEVWEELADRVMELCYYSHRVRHS